MIRHTNNKPMPLYGGIFKNKKVGETIWIYCICEVTNISRTSMTNQLKIDTKLFSNNSDDFFYLVVDSNDKIPFQKGDIIMFKGWKDIYDERYASKHFIKSNCVFATPNYLAIVNHLKYNDKDDANKWIDDVINNKKFAKLCQMQADALANSSLTATECTNIINQEIINETNDTKQNILDEFEK